MTDALVSPMSLEAQDHSPSALQAPTQATKSSPQDKELEALLNASVPPHVIARILEAIQKRSSDPLALYIRAYRWGPGAVLPPLLASLLTADPSLELLWLGPPEIKAPSTLPTRSESKLLAVEAPKAAHLESATQHYPAAPSHVSIITQAPASLPTMLDSSSNPPESVSSFSESATAPNAPHLAEPSVARGNHALPAENSVSAASAQKMVTYHKVKKDPEAAAAREQQKERLVQLIDQVIELSASSSSDLLACLHHLYAEVSVQRQNRILHKLSLENLNKLLCFIDSTITCGCELAKKRSVDTSLSLDAAQLALVLMNADLLPGTVYAEERLEGVTRLIRDHLGCHVFPVLDPSLAAAVKKEKEKEEKERGDSDSGSEEVEYTKKKPKKGRATTAAPKGTAAICHRITQLLDGVQEFLARQNVNDSIILDLTSSCLGILFLEPLPGLQAALTSMQLAALNVARTIYARYHVHRDNMLTDVFAHMLRLPTAARTMRSYVLPEEDKRIQTVAALVMQLLQSSTLLPGMSTSRGIDLAPGDESGDSPSSYETAARTAAQFMTSCLHKCIVKSEETDAKGVLMNLVTDLLSVITLPEWPAAAVLLQALVSACIHVLRQPSQDTKKEGKENKETVATKAVALEIFKEIAPAYKQLVISAQGSMPFRPPDVRTKEEDKVDCVCGVDRGMAETRDMISCTACNRWYHAACVSVSATVFAGAAEWLCDDCLFARQMATDPSALYAPPPKIDAPPKSIEGTSADIDMSDAEEAKKKEASSEKDEKTEVSIKAKAMEAAEEEAPKSKRKGGAKGGAKKGGKASNSNSKGGKAKRSRRNEDEPEAKLEKDKKQEKEKEEEKEKERLPPTPEQLEQYKLLQLLLNYLLPRQAEDANALCARRFLLCQFAAEAPDDAHTLAYCMGQWQLVPSPTQARLSRRGTSKILLRLLATKSFAKGFDMMLSAVATSLMDPNQLLRSKGIRTLTAIVQVPFLVQSEVDPSVLAIDRVRVTVQERTQDISKVVREATIDLVGKYIHSAPHLTAHYFDTIAKRITDTGVLVRRKVVSILVELLSSQPDGPRVADICTLLVGRVNDKDESIKKLVSQSFMELWFRENASAHQLQQRVQQIMQTLANAKNAPWLTSLLVKLLGKREEKKQQQLAVTCQKMCDILFNRLLAHESARAAADKTSPKFAEETKGMTDAIWTLSVFCKAAPQFLLPHITHLSYYLATTAAQPKGPHEPKVVELVAGMVASVLPLLQNPSTESIQTLEENLSRLVCQQGMSVVPSCVHCLGVLESTVANNSALMVDLYNKFYTALEKGDKAAVVRALFTLPLLCKDYDMQTRGGLKNVAEQLWSLYSYYRDMYKSDQQIAVTAIQGMGALFIAFPSLLPRASQIIHQTLASPVPALRIHMCRALLATLQHSADSLLAASNVEALDDTSQWISPKGLDSTGAIAEHAEKAAELLFDPQDDVRHECLSLITVMLKQGLIHPMQCIARLVALNADQRPALAVRAYNLVAQIDDRYPDMLWNRLLDGIKASYAMQKTAFGNAIAVKTEGKEVHSVWERVYLLPKKQSAQRIERSQFLASLVKFFDLPDTAKVDLGQQAYLAEVLAYLPYRIMEDPLSVVYHINKLVAMRGEALLSQLKEKKEAKDLPKGLLDHCANMSLLLVLKNFLKVLYCLSESKCRAFMPSSSGTTSEGKERKEKQLVPRSEVLQRASPFPGVITDDQQIAEKFKALMKADASDNLIGLQAPLRKGTQKRSRVRPKKEESGSDSEEAEAPRKPAKKAAKKRVRVVNGPENEENDAGEDSDEYLPQ